MHLIYFDNIENVLYLIPKAPPQLYKLLQTQSCTEHQLQSNKFLSEKCQSDFILRKRKTKTLHRILEKTPKL